MCDNAVIVNDPAPQTTGPPGMDLSLGAREKSRGGYRLDSYILLRRLETAEGAAHRWCEASLDQLELPVTCEDEWPDGGTIDSFACTATFYRREVE